MSYAAPTSWTDVDYAGNALSWSSRAGKLIYPAYEMIRRAVVERCDAAEESVPVVLQTSLGPGDLIPTGYFKAVDDIITDLIPDFVDHTTAIAGEAEPTMWTETTLMAELGETRISHAQADGNLPLGTWSKQVHDILNLHRWTAYAAVSNQDQVRKIVDELNATDGDWATCVSDFAAATWNNLDGLADNPLMDSTSRVRAWAEQASGDFELYRRRVDVYFKHEFQRACTLHLYAGLTEGDDITTYSNDNSDHGATEDELVLIDETTTPVADNDDTHIGMVGDFKTSPRTAEPTNNAGTYGYNVSTYDLWVIAKFDVTGGFQFQA